MTARKIKLTQGYYAIVDGEDFDRLSRYKWYAAIYHTSVYAKRSTYINRVRSTVFMHRDVMNCIPGDGIEIDHRNPKKTLDNRKKNLRIATHAQNQYNRPRLSNNQSGFKGVTITPSGRYRATIGVGGKRYHLGTRDTAEEASKLFQEKAAKLHGEFARHR